MNEKEHFEYQKIPYQRRKIYRIIRNAKISIEYESNNLK